MGSYDLTQFRGVFPAAMTYFDAEGRLDEAGTTQHWRWLVEQGAQGLVVAGTSGEFIALTIEERLRLFYLAVEEFGGRLPIIAGSGHASTRLTIDISRQAEQIGVDSLIVILPYYSRPPAESVANHFRRLRESVDLPIMLYNNPANTACSAMSAEQIAELVDEDVVHMVKSTMESVTPIHDLRHFVGDRMRVFYGSFLSAFEALAAGADGWVSGVLNVTTPAALEMHRLLEQNDCRGAREIWQRMLPIVHLYTYQRLGSATDLSIYRRILEHWGRDGGFSREPFSPLTVEQTARLGELLQACGWSAPWGQAKDAPGSQAERGE